MILALFLRLSTWESPHTMYSTIHCFKIDLVAKLLQRGRSETFGDLASWIINPLFDYLICLHMAIS